MKTTTDRELIVEAMTYLSQAVSLQAASQIPIDEIVEMDRREIVNAEGMNLVNTIAAGIVSQGLLSHITRTASEQDGVSVTGKVYVITLDQMTALQGCLSYLLAREEGVTMQ